MVEIEVLVIVFADWVGVLLLAAGGVHVLLKVMENVIREAHSNYDLRHEKYWRMIQSGDILSFAVGFSSCKSCDE